MARKIVITSGKGGVGKTTVCANLGCKLAYLGYRVVMLDADVGLNNLDVVMGMENRVCYDVLDVAEGKCRIRQALVQDLYYPSLYMLPSTHIKVGNKLTASHFAKIVDRLDDYDYVLIDCPAGIDSGFHRAVSVAREAYVVVTPSIPSVRDADKVINLMGGYKISAIGLIVNRVRGDAVLRGEGIGVSDISRVLRCPIRGVIPDTDDISRGVVLRSSESSLPFEILCDNVIRGGSRLYDCTQLYKGLKGRLRRLVRT